MYDSAPNGPPTSPSASAHDVPRSVTPMLLCAPYHGPQYIERSAMIGPLAWMSNDTSVAAISGIASATIVVRLVAARVRCSTFATPLLVRYRIVTSTGFGFGFASSTNVSKKSPVCPSARNQCVDPAGTAADEWPPRKIVSPFLKYIARSHRIGLSARTVVPNERVASSGISFA